MGATTSLLTIRREDKNEPMSLEAALALAKSSNSPFIVDASRTMSIRRCSATAGRFHCAPASACVFRPS
jgi:hypothetical protein